jgi:nucleoside-diphosphate-sugar epimerase
MACFTVIGGSGFIGSELVDHLCEQGHSCRVPARGEPLVGEGLGHVVYCAGLTGDWRARPYDAIDAHVSALAQLVRGSSFDSLMYLSSTRVYDRHGGPIARETDELRMSPHDTEDLFALSKAAGEGVALAAGGTVARLSNVYGANLEEHAFLAVVLRDAVESGRVTLESSLESARDFVSLADTVSLLARIALAGSERIYNVASGVCVTNLDLTDALRRLTGCEVIVRPGAPRIVRPPIDISRAAADFGFSPVHLLDELPGLIEAIRSIPQWS